MPSLAHYMEQYDQQNGASSNKVLHGVGIPLIFAGMILLLFVKWIWGAGFFLGGWALLFLGHRIEGNRPAFFHGLVYLPVGPIWVAREVWTVLAGTRRKPASEGTPQGNAPK